MSSTTRVTALRYTMIATGLIFIFGIYAMDELWASGWHWGVGHSHYFPMILGVYATLGVALIIASRDPLANRNLIWFTVASSVVHSLVMLAQALLDPAETGHLLGDVPALLVVAVALAALTPRGAVMSVVNDRGERRVA